jgi:multidrug efflux pump subunit AcrA (membrane-fusion protein)
LSKQRIYTYLALLWIGALLGGCALLPASRTERAAADEATPTPIPTAIVPIKPTYKVQRGEVVDELEFSGRISPVTEEDLFFRKSGRVRSVFFKRNDFVVKGDVIAELEIDNLERELESAQLDLERSSVRLEQAQRALDYQIKVAQANLEIAQIRLAALQAEAKPDNVAIAVQQKQVGLAQLEMERLSDGLDPLLVSDVTRTELNVKKLEAEIAEARLIAPFDGKLLSVSITPGQSMEAYRPASAIADVKDLEVSADLISSQMEDLVEGMNTSIVLVSRPGVVLTGTIRRLPYPYGSGGRGTTVEDLDKSTRIALEQSAVEAGFELGDLVRVKVELERKADVLWLPPQALRVFDGRRFAVVQDGDVQRRVDVAVGIQTQERVEIEEGLEEGQVVIGQ